LIFNIYIQKENAWDAVTSMISKHTCGIFPVKDFEIEKAADKIAAAQYIFL
jgi:hypothetical protein